MVVGFAIGLFEFGRIAGIAALGAVGGLAVGVRVVLFRDDLLVGIYFVNWIIAGLCGLAGLTVVFLMERFGVVSGPFFPPKINCNLWTIRLSCQLQQELS